MINMLGPLRSGAAAPDWLSRTDRRLLIALRSLAALVALVSIVVLVVATTARRTVLDTAYYQRVLDDERAYDRLYDQVLVDPASAGVTRDLLDRLPVPQEAVLANLKVVLPPTTLRQLVNEQINAAVRYLRGDTGTLGLSVDLTPIVSNLAVLAQDYLGDLVASIQQRDVPDYSAFVKSLNTAVDDLAGGRKPLALPVVRLTDAQRSAAQRTLLGLVPPASRTEVTPVVAAALDTGDLASALAAVGPYALSTRVTSAYQDLVARAGSLRWDIVPDLHSANVQLGAVKTVRSVSTALLGPVRVTAILLGLAALAFLWLSTAPGRRRPAVVGAVLVAGGALALALMIVARWRVRRTVPAPPSGWPPSLRALVNDLQHAGAGSLFRVGLILSAIPLLAGLLVLGGAWLWGRQSVALAEPQPANRRNVVLLAGGVGAVVLATVLGVAFVPAQAGAQRCLGSARMCSLRYDQVAFLATHNSMSSTADRFIGPLQDPDIVSQLDEGARALLIDTHTWERPDQVVEQLDSSDLPPDLKAKLPELVNMANPPRPGLWLCHAICRAGATPLVPTLKRIGQWLDDHPGEIVTLIIQDEILSHQTQQAFAEAGLDRLLFDPAENADASWPTLGEMVHSGRRLVVFAENQDGPTPWYRNFYRYGMETPFTARTPSELTCASLRGGVGKRLFLLNNFITVVGGSRLDAAEVNAKQFVLDRVHRCEAERSRPVNFVAVDYATLGDALGAVDSLNAERLAHAG